MKTNTSSIKVTTAFILTVGSLLLVMCSGIIFYFLSSSKHDSDIVDAAGRQRMLSQAMAKSIVAYALSRNGLQSLEAEVGDLDRYITRMRTLYTEKVIGPAKQAGLGLSMHPDQEFSPSIPYPATFTRMLGESVTDEVDMAVTLMAGEPVNPGMKLQDAVDREAFAALKADPKAIFSKAVERDGKLYMRFYTADIATLPACAACHTRMTGKSFRVGELLGIRRYEVLYAADAAEGHRRLNPDLGEYETAREIFTQTLAAFKSGGRYPADLQMTEYREYGGTKEKSILRTIEEVEGVWHRFELAAQNLLQAEVNSDAYWRAYENVLTGANELRAVSNELTSQFAAHALRNQQRVFWLVILMAALSMLIFGATYLILNRAIIEPVTRLVDVANRIAQGDLTQTTTVSGKSEIAMLANALNTVSSNLNSMVSKIKSAARNLTDSTSRIVEVSRQMETGLERQAGQTQAVAGSMEQMEETSREMSQHADEAAGAAAQASEVAVEGGEIVRRSIDGMVQVSGTVTESAKKVEELARHSEQIDQIVTVIDDIANQTNLLALNAAIEAARAGEQGRGFAVVADEVRGLANRTTEATREIAEMVKVIQAGTEAAVVSMEAGRKEAEHGVEMANQAGASLEQIVQMVGELSSRIERIAAASRSQSEVTHKVTTNVAAVAEISEQTEQDARLCAASSNELAKLAGELRGMVEQFRI